MQRREKILAIALASAVAFWVIIPIFDRMIFAPLRDANERLRAAKASLVTQEDLEFEVQLAERKLAGWKARSLPPDPLDAQRLYQEWLTDLAHVAGLQPEKVTPIRQTARRKHYVAVQVSLSGQATLEQLARFWFLFERTDLLHRIASFNLDRDDALPERQLAFSLTAEGLSLPSAPSRDRLFAETTLAAPLEATDTELEVTATEGFPDKGEFRVRIGNEYLQVAATDGNRWTVERGAEQTTPGGFAQSELVELAPLAEDFAQRTLDHYKTLLANNPFFKPAPPVDYQFRFGTLADRTLIRGDTLSFRATVSGYDPSNGAPTFRIDGTPPPGMSIDASTGEFTWQPADGQPTGTFPVTLVATQPRGGATASATFTVTFREPNEPPVLAAIPPQTLYLGRTLSFQVSAEDPEEEGVTYKLGGDAPEGASIDPQSGQFTWTAPPTFEPGDYEVTLTATDQGGASSSQTVSIRAADDAALFTHLIGTFLQGERREAWFRDFASNERTVVHEGSQFTFADITGSVREIELSHVQFESDGRLWQIDVGQNLRRLRPVAQSPGEETAAVSAERRPVGR